MALIFPCSLVILISPPSAVLFLLLAWEVIVPVVMSPWVVMFIVPAFPPSVLLAEMVLLGAVISPASILMIPPSPVPVVSVNILPSSWNVSPELISISPPFPMSDVDADIFVFSAIVRFSVSMLMGTVKQLAAFDGEVGYRHCGGNAESARTKFDAHPS